MTTEQDREEELFYDLMKLINSKSDMCSDDFELLIITRIRVHCKFS